MNLPKPTDPTPREIFLNLRKKYRKLYDAVYSSHRSLLARGRSTHGHGWDHDIMVAQNAAIIAENRRIGEMGWITGLMHSTDRHYSTDEAVRIINEYFLLLPQREFMTKELQMMKEALEEHSSLNSDTDNPVTIVLKDADRLGNLGPLTPMRAGQFQDDLPAFLFETLGKKHPETTFRKPKSCYDGLFGNIEWETMLRLPKAKKRAKPLLRFLRNYHKAIEKQVADTGLHPWPED